MSSNDWPDQELKKIWQQVCASLQLQLSPAVYSTWIVSSALIHIELLNDQEVLVTISSPSAFHATNIEKNFNHLFKEAFDVLIGKSCQFHYVVGSPLAPHAAAQQRPPGYQSYPSNSVSFTESGFSRVHRTDFPQSAATPGGQSGLGGGHAPHSMSPPPQMPFIPRPMATSPRVEDLFSESTLRSAQEDRTGAVARRIGLRVDYTFETFAVSTTNEMAHAAATAVSNHPGDAYNPLFLYGGVGVGKTHLMHAIANNILQQNPNATIIYSTGEEFTNEIVSAIQTKKATQFKQKYRNAHMLLIDDVQFLAGKNTVQEEFFHTFNALAKQNSQIVLTSDRPPHEIPLLEDRLRSRFEAGLMIDIGQPSFELRTAILLVKAKASRLQIPIELAKTIASRVESARKIEGIITSIRSEVELKHRLISPELIDDILKNEVEHKRPRIKAKPADIIKTVSDHYRIKQTALKGKNRVKNLVTARHIAMYLMKKELSLPLVEIGQWFSGRDHTSVLHAVHKIEEELRTNEIIQQDVSALRMTLAAG